MQYLYVRRKGGPFLSLWINKTGFEGEEKDERGGKINLSRQTEKWGTTRERKKNRKDS